LGAAIAGAVIGAGSLAMQGYSASQSGSAPYDLSQVARSNLKGIQTYEPYHYLLEQMYGQLYGGLGSQNANRFLFGSPGGTQDITVGWGDKQQTWHLGRPKQEGFLNTLERAQPYMARSNMQTVAGASQLVPMIEGMDPYRGAINSSLGQEAMNGLNLGYQMDPALVRELTQAGMENSSLRGFGHSPMDAYAVYGSLGQEAQRLRQQRLGFAQNVSGLLDEDVGRALNISYGPGGMGPGSLMQMYTQSQQQGPNRFNPYQNMVATRAPDNGLANALAGMGGGMANISGNLLGSYFRNQPQQAQQAQQQYQGPSNPDWGGYG
jgi:hypothetical protein